MVRPPERMTDTPPHPLCAYLRGSMRALARGEQTPLSPPHIPSGSKQSRVLRFVPRAREVETGRECRQVGIVPRHCDPDSARNIRTQRNHADAGRQPGRGARASSPPAPDFRATTTRMRSPRRRGAQANARAASAYAAGCVTGAKAGITSTTEASKSSRSCRSFRSEPPVCSVSASQLGRFARRPEPRIPRRKPRPIAVPRRLEQPPACRGFAGRHDPLHHVADPGLRAEGIADLAGFDRPFETLRIAVGADRKRRAARAAGAARSGRRRRCPARLPRDSVRRASAGMAIPHAQRSWMIPACFASAECA